MMTQCSDHAAPQQSLGIPFVLDFACGGVLSYLRIRMQEFHFPRDNMQSPTQIPADFNEIFHTSEELDGTRIVPAIFTCRLSDLYIVFYPYIFLHW